MKTLINLSAILTLVCIALGAVGFYALGWNYFGLLLLGAGCIFLVTFGALCIADAAPQK
jgi:hypothetical protein